MLRATAVQLLLLSASILLLWSSSCTASPMWRGWRTPGRSTPGSSTPGPSSPPKNWWGNSARPADALEAPVDVPVGSGRPVAGFRPDKNFEAHIRNQPFYFGYPVMDVTKILPKYTKYARDRYGGVWLYDSDHPASARFVDQTKEGLPSSDHISGVLRQIQQANAAEAEGGLPARALKAGWPFSAPRSAPREWTQVWNEAKVHAVPAPTEVADWESIRTTLQKDGAVKLLDGNRALAFRLEEDGSVAMQVFNHLHKRSIVASDKAGSDDTFKNELVKRADPLGTFNGQPDHAVNYLRRMNTLPYQAPNVPYTEDEKEAQYAGLIHYRGYPVLDMNSVAKSTLMHALQDHDQVWMASNFPVNHQLYRRPFRINRGTNVFGDGWEKAVEHLNAAAALRGTYGNSIMLLKYGRPFLERSRWYSKPSWKKVAKTYEFNPAQHDIQILRYKLGSSNQLRVKMEGGVTLGLRLDKHGMVEMENISRYIRG